MSERAPYSRVYWAIVDDPKFATIYDDDRHLSAWLRLILLADQSYPASAPIPFGTRRASLDALVTAGLIDLGTGHRFRIHGLDSERERRKQAATSRGPNGHQTVPERVSDPRPKPSLAEPSTSRAETPRDPADIYWQLTGKFPVEKTLAWLDDLTGKYGSEPTIAALATAFSSDRSTQTLLGRSQDILRAGARQLDRQEKVAEQAALREKRAKPRTLEPWQEEFRAAVERQYQENGGTAA